MSRSPLLRIKGITFGEGRPKICVPLAGDAGISLTDEARIIAASAADAAEFRADRYPEGLQLPILLPALERVREILSDKPLIFTLRSVQEGGSAEFSPQEYLGINLAVLNSGLADLIDVEFSQSAKVRQVLIAEAQARGIAVILSSHNFAHTPATDDLTALLESMLSLGADVPKLSVMPHSPQDVLALLDASSRFHQRHPQQPFIAISSGPAGALSRFSGEIFGSALTFAAASAATARAGQIPVADMQALLNLIGQYCRPDDA